MHLKNHLTRLGVSVLLVLFVAGSFSFGQRLTGKITGIVSDEEGNPLPGVSIEISSDRLLGGIHSQVSDNRGLYRFINLPPGTYKIVFKLQGFQTAENNNLPLELESTITVNVSLKPAKLEEAVTVIATAPVVDVTSSGLKMSYDKDALEKLPFSRNSYFEMVNQTPGFTTGYGESSSRFVAYGSNAEENGMYMDGVDMSNPELGTAAMFPSQDIFEEVQISGIGNPAEYGNFAGAVVNIVTKSGGNTFSGSVSYMGQFHKLTADNNPQPFNPATGEGQYSENLKKWYDYTFSMGGPIVKDKIWFFGLHNKTFNTGTGFGEDPAYPTDYGRNNQLVKISGQLTKAHKLVLAYNRNEINYSGAATLYTLPESVQGEHDLTHSWSAMWTWLVSNDSFFELKYAGYYLPLDSTPTLGGDIHRPIHYDGATGVTSNGLWYPFFTTYYRHQVNANFSHFAEGFLAGDHEFKVGVQFNRGSADNYGGYGGGKFYYYYGGSPYLLIEKDTNAYGGAIVNVGAFVDDSWKIGNRLTINLGLRYDHHDASIPSLPLRHNFEKTGQMGKSVDDLIVWNAFSPRIGFAYQLTSDQKTLLKASYGRYYIYPYIANWELPGPNAPDTKFYLWNGTGYDLLYVIPTEAGYIMDPKIKEPYYDQFSVGIVRELMANFSAGLTAIYKKGGNAFGYEDRGGIYEQVQRTSPDNGKTYTVYNWVGGDFKYYLTNPKGWGQTYKALILEIDKRYSNRWMMTGSVTLSRVEGLNLASGSTGANSMSQALVWYSGQYGADPNALINAKGPLNIDKTWLVKLSAGYNFPLDILASVNYIYQSGRPLLKFVRIFDLNQPNVPARIFAEKKGTERWPGEHLINFRISKVFSLYKTVKLDFTVDIFNLLNDNTIQAWQSDSVWNAAYKIPAVIPASRRAQLGIKLTF